MISEDHSGAESEAEVGRGEYDENGKPRAGAGLNGASADANNALPKMAGLTDGQVASMIALMKSLTTDDGDPQSALSSDAGVLSEASSDGSGEGDCRITALCIITQVYAFGLSVKIMTPYVFFSWFLSVISSCDHRLKAVAALRLRHRFAFGRRALYILALR